MRESRFSLLGGMTLALAGSSCLLADPVTILVVSANQTVVLGASLDVALRIDGLGNQTAPSLGTFDLNLDFDATILSFTNAVFGDPILGDQLDPTGVGNSIAFLTPGIGTVGLFGLSLASANDLNALQAASFILATLTFSATGAGTSALALHLNALGDENGSDLPSSIQDGTVTVTAVTSVPEPSDFWQFAVALGLLLGHGALRSRSSGLIRLHRVSTPTSYR